MKQRWSQTCTFEHRNRGIKWKKSLAEQGKTHLQTKFITRTFNPKMFTSLLVHMLIINHLTLWMIFLLLSIFSTNEFLIRDLLIMHPESYTRTFFYDNFRLKTLNTMSAGVGNKRSLSGNVHIIPIVILFYCYFCYLNTCFYSLLLVNIIISVHLVIRDMLFIRVDHCLTAYKHMQSDTSRQGILLETHSA